MHDLIKKLSAQHIELEQALAGIRPHQFRTGEARNRLHRVRDLLRDHINIERNQLYPVLEQAARNNCQLARQLRLLSDDLDVISTLADGFVAKYAAGEPGLIDFATDHNALLTVVRIRLRREEQLLFPLYESVCLN